MSALNVIGTFLTSTGTVKVKDAMLCGVNTDGLSQLNSIPSFPVPTEVYNNSNSSCIIGNSVFESLGENDSTQTLSVIISYSILGVISTEIKEFLFTSLSRLDYYTSTGCAPTISAAPNPANGTITTTISNTPSYTNHCNLDTSYHIISGTLFDFIPQTQSHQFSSCSCLCGFSIM